MATNKNSRLQELGGSDYEIADGQPNIKGWDVKDAQGNKIGEVDELIFDTQSLKVRYIVVDLEGNVFDLEDRDVLVPIGLAQLDDKEDDVILPGVTAEQLRALPEYDEDHLTPEIETAVRNVFSGASLATGAAVISSTDTDIDADFYNHEHFNDESLYQRRGVNRVEDVNTATTSDTQSLPVNEENLEIGKKTVEKGGLRLRNRIGERPVEENMKFRDETVHDDREDVNRPATNADFDRLRQEEIEMRERTEVPVVNKEAPDVDINDVDPTKRTDRTDYREDKDDPQTRSSRL